jgi:copper resistance protein C
MRTRLLVVASLLTAIAMLSAPSVSAHAAYKSSIPAADSTVASPPTSVLITFAEELKALNVTVKGPGGADITNGPALINLSDRTNASVPIHPAGNGRYEVDWNNVSNDDGDPDSGTFFFTVGPATAPAVVSSPVPAVAAAAPAPPPPPAPAPASRPPNVASDGRTLAGESAATQALFLAVWGDRAAVEWATEHTAAIGGR